MKHLLGLDIGGTKCAVHLGDPAGQPCGNDLRFATPHGFPAAWEMLRQTIAEVLQRANLTPSDIAAIGVSCGGPLDSKQGLVLSPPNLPGWDAIPLPRLLTDTYGTPAYLMNDANACALAEFHFGAGRGCANMVFCTMGTGFGSGLILDGRLYEGTNSMAGEIGHLLLDPSGPEAFGKKGSVEAFVGGNGIKTCAQLKARQPQHQAAAETYRAASNNDFTVKSLAAAARDNDPFALGVFHDTGRRLGLTLSILVDLINPERIVVGSIFERCEPLLRPAMQAELDESAIPRSLACCRILPARLGDHIGAYASLAAARHALG